jgi:hypothetical protein
MVGISTRSSLLAVKPEVTEGTPVAPTAGTDFIALQDDWEFSPSFQTLENAEFRASIGIAKPILGAEEPTASGSHYLRASGVEGQAPNYNDLPKAWFGSEQVNVTERVTTVGSTVSQLVLAAGGSDFPIGVGALIKDGVNGYRVRVSTGNSGNNVPMSFNVPVAPATGVSLGKCVAYLPVDTGHQTLTLWQYLGNGGAVQMVSGCRVTEFSFDATAGELLNASYSFEGIGYFLDPIEITSSTRFLDFTDDDGTWAAQVPVKWYKDPHELADALENAMAAANPGETPTVIYSDATGKFNIKTTGTLLSLLFSTGANTANTIATKIGFAVADETGTAATTGYNSDTAQNLASPFTPTLDASDPLAVKFHEVMFGDQDDYACLNASAISFSGSLTRRVIESICAESGRLGSVINARESTINLTVLLEQYDADKFRKYREGDKVRFQYSFGTKTGGNWNPGFVGYLFTPSATITSFQITDDDGLATLEMELQPFVETAGVGEIFLGML